MAHDALVTTVVGSYPQPDWLIDRERLGERLPPRVRARELWRVPEPFLEEAQDDATTARRPGHGARRRRRDHRRRDAAGELLEPLRDRARRRRPGRARRRARPDRPREPGPAGRRPDPAHAAGRGPRRRVPPLAHRPADQDHGPGAVHDDAAGPERPLRRTSGASRSRTRRRSTRSCGTSRRPEPTSSRSTSRTSRRAPSRRASTPSRRSTARSTGSRARRSSTPASATRTSSTTGSTGYPFLRELDDCAATHLSLEAAQPDLDPEVLRELPDKTIVLGVLDLGSSEVETPEVVAERIRRALAVVPPRAARRRAGLRDEVPPARAGVREARGDGGRCAARRG